MPKQSRASLSALQRGVDIGLGEVGCYPIYQSPVEGRIRAVSGATLSPRLDSAWRGRGPLAWTISHRCVTSLRHCRWKLFYISLLNNKKSPNKLSCWAVSEMKIFDEPTRAIWQLAEKKWGGNWRLSHERFFLIFPSIFKWRTICANSSGSFDIFYRWGFGFSA